MRGLGVFELVLLGCGAGICGDSISDHNQFCNNGCGGEWILIVVSSTCVTGQWGYESSVFTCRVTQPLRCPSQHILIMFFLICCCWRRSMTHACLLLLMLSFLFFVLTVASAVLFDFMPLCSPCRTLTHTQLLFWVDICADVKLWCWFVSVLPSSKLTVMNWVHLEGNVTTWEEF